MEAKEEADAGTKRKMPMIERRLGDVTKRMNNKAVSTVDDVIGQQQRVFSIASGTPLSLALHREEIGPKTLTKRVNNKCFYFYS